jgi:hypothetical protein
MSSFADSFKRSLPSSIAIIACAAVMVLCSRLAFGLLESYGGLSYIYATSGSGSILEQVCEILTGSSVIAFIAIGGIVGGMIAALLGSAALRFSRSLTAASAPQATQAAQPAKDGEEVRDAKPAQAPKRASIAPQFAVFALWTVVATLLIVAVAAFVFLGTVSDVQLTSVTSKLGSSGGATPGSGLMLPLTLAMLWTLLLMGGALAFAAVSVAHSAKRGPVAATVFLVVAAALVGVLLVLLSVSLFTRFNVISVDYPSLNTWLGISIVANLAVTALGLCLSRVFIGRKRDMT